MCTKHWRQAPQDTLNTFTRKNQSQKEKMVSQGTKRTDKTTRSNSFHKQQQKIKLTEDLLAAYRSLESLEIQFIRM
jgi:hypothetical protein